MNKQQLYLKRKAPELWTAINNKNLWFVRSTEIYNLTTKIQLAFDSRERYVNMTNVHDRKQIFEIPERSLFNQSINLLVLPFSGNFVWDCRRYIFVAPMSEFVGELVGGTHQDYLTVGSHTYTEESYLLVPNDEVEKVKTDFPKLKSTIVGYNYPETLFDQEGMKCISKLSEGVAPGLETPRMAVENLFDKISKEKGIDIWRCPKEKQYTGKLLQPVIHPSNDGNNHMSIRVDSKGTQINVDALLEKFMSLFMADHFCIEKIAGKIIVMKEELRKNATSKSGNFLSDYTDPGKCKSYESKPCDLLPADLYANKISYDFKEFEKVLTDPDRFNPTAKRYLTAVYDKSFNILSYLEILYKYKKTHPGNTQYINSFIFNFDKPNNKLADVLVILLNKKDFLPIRNMIISLSTTVQQECYVDDHEFYGTPQFFEQSSRFNEKMNKITEQLHIEVEQLKKHNSTLKNPAIRKKVNKSVNRATAQLMGGFKQPRNKTVKKLRRM